MEKIKQPQKEPKPKERLKENKTEPSLQFGPSAGINLPRLGNSGGSLNFSWADSEPDRPLFSERFLQPQVDTQSRDQEVKLTWTLPGKFLLDFSGFIRLT